MTFELIQIPNNIAAYFMGPVKRMRPIAPKPRFSFLVHDVSRMRRTFIDQALRPLGITRAQWWALGNISRHVDDGMIQTELARLLEMGKVSTGGLIDRLEEAGLVYRHPDKLDRRVKRVFMTPKGLKVLDHISGVGSELDNILFKDISEQEIEAAAAVLARVKANVREALASPVAAAPLLPKSKRRKSAADNDSSLARLIAADDTRDIAG